MKIFFAYLKDLSKHRRMAFFFLKYLFSFRDIDTPPPCKSDQRRHHKVRNQKWQNTQQTISLKLPKQRSWNPAPQICIQKKQNETLIAVTMTTVLPLVLSQ